MKLSDVKGDRMFDVMADAIVFATKLAADKNAKEFFTRKPCPQGLTPTQFVVQRVAQHVPALLRDHKEDFIDLLSSIKGVSRDEYCETLNLAVLTADVVDLFNDDAFKDLFTSPQSGTGSTPSTSAQENTSVQSQHEHLPDTVLLDVDENSPSGYTGFTSQTH